MIKTATQQTDAADGRPKCPDCGGQNQPGVTRCWLCGASLRRDVSPPIEAQVVFEPRRDRGFSFTLMSLMGVMTLAAIGAGLARDAPGLAALIGLVGAPALAATAIAAGRRRRSGAEMTWGERIGTFLLSAAAVIGILMAVVVAAIVAFFVWCFVAMTSGW